MISPPIVDDPDLVRQVLCDETFLPHRSPYQVAGPTLELRERMARFSAPDSHPQRRAALTEVLEPFDAGDAEAVARELAAAEIARGGDVESVAATVPTATLARLLGLPCDRAALVADVEAVVRVIGRGEPPSAASDAATDRLLGLAPDPAEAVAVASVLYQNFDATAAAIRNAEAARRRGSAPEPAVARTRRVATRPVTVGATPIGTGGEVVLEIGSAGLPFGAGPHECPGRLLAEAIVRGASSALGRVGRQGEPHATDA